ncbi:hypothetical protein HDU89_005734 [Geranomyces variabilis]|nr:hypothetical protein HDU89_005734 [Geranomyces variabilis]
MITHGSYWYTNIPCLDASRYKSLILTIAIPAGAFFTVQLQTAGAATGCPAGGPINRAGVVTSSYAASLTGAKQNVTIPLTAFAAANAAVDLKRVTAVSFASFSTAGVTYQIGCAFWV